MAKKSPVIISITGGTPQGGELPHPMVRTVDRIMSIQRPVVLGHIRSIRRRNPHASPEQLVRILENRYLAAVTTGGAAVGASAVIPGVGTGMALVLSGVETAGFLEATALFAQSVAEVHGIAVSDPERARALVMTMMLGKEGSDLVRQLGAQVIGNGIPRTAYWGQLVTSTVPNAVMGPLMDKLKASFIKQFAAKGTASVVGKAIPFGIGAVIGGTGNHLVGRRVLKNSRFAFGPPPMWFSLELAPTVRDTAAPRAITRGATALSRGVLSVIPATRKALTRAKPDAATKAPAQDASHSATRDDKPHQR